MLAKRRPSRLVLATLLIVLLAITLACGAFGIAVQRELVLPPELFVDSGPVYFWSRSGTSDNTLPPFEFTTLGGGPRFLVTIPLQTPNQYWIVILELG